MFHFISSAECCAPTAGATLVLGGGGGGSGVGLGEGGGGDVGESHLAVAAGLHLLVVIG